MAIPSFGSLREWLSGEQGGVARAPDLRPETVCMLGSGAKHCGVASYLFEQARRFFVANGYRLVESCEGADVLVVDGCAATESARGPGERLVLDLVGRYPAKRIVVYGCLAGYSPELARHANVVLVPPAGTDRLSDLFAGTVAMGGVAMAAPPVRMTSVQDPRGQRASDAHLLISQGCVHHCTYCNVKLVKGAVRSRPLADLRREAVRLVEQGEREIMLLADDCGSWGRDLGTDFAALVAELVAIDERVKWKVYYLFPGLFLEYSERLWQPLADGRLSYLCVPLQSGSRRILNLMNRGYDPDRVAERLRALRAANPAVYLFSHFIFDFPSESVEEFELSLRLMPLFDACLLVEYSDNPRTRAARLPDRCDERDRAAKLERLERFVAAEGAQVESLAGGDTVNWRLQLPPARARRG